MYWFYYNVSSDSSDASYARLRSASRWMHEAANVVDFSDHDIAQAYADVADFTTDITPRIEEGTDAGLYAPEFARLQTLVASTSQSDNDVFRLNTAQLVLDALRAYPRKFRADGVSRDDLEALVANAHGLTQDVSSTSSDMDATLADLNEVYPATRQAVEDAFVDVTGNQQ
jgi:serine/threonine-protein kinase